MFFWRTNAEKFCHLQAVSSMTQPLQIYVLSFHFSVWRHCCYMWENEKNGVKQMLRVPLYIRRKTIRHLYMGRSIGFLLVRHYGQL